MPARKADTTNAFILKVMTLMPTLSAAMRLSRAALMARPSLELIRFSTTNRVNSTSTKPTGKVAMRVMWVAPRGPPTIILPSAARCTDSSFRATRRPWPSKPT